MNTPVKLPDALDVEKTLLGMAIVMGDVMSQTDIDESVFRLERHAVIWRILRGLYQAKRSIDYVTVIDALSSAGLLEMIGGPAYIAELTTYPVFGVDVNDYTRIIKDRAVRQSTIILAQELAKAAFDLDGDFDAARSAALDQLARADTGNRKVVHVSDAMGRLYDEAMERSENPAEIYGLDTGFADLNQQTAGLQPGEMFLLAGDPGVGKTLLAVQIASQMAEKGAPGVIYELEMGDVQLCRRVVSAKTGITPRKMRAGLLNDSDKQALGAEVGRSESVPLWISDDTSWTTAAIRANLTRMRSQYGVRWFMVDYLMLMTDTYGQNDIERSNYISKSLRRICKDLQLAGLVVHSMNKAGLGSEAKNLSHLAGAVGVSFDADVVCFMTKHVLSEEDKGAGKKPQANVRTLQFAKHREDNPDKFLHLVLRPGLPAFADYAREPNAQRVTR